MRWNVTEFTENAGRQFLRYKNDNKWWHWGSAQVDIFNAWKLYSAASRSTLGNLLLGDAKIRTNQALLMNFGLSSGSGLSDQDELRVVGALLAKRNQLEGPRSGPTINVLGPGSILNDQNWTPLLNDTYILAGVHPGHDFYWAEPGFDLDTGLGHSEFQGRLHNFGEVAPQYQSMVNRDEAYLKEKWKLYIMKHSNFWAPDGTPRIFAREVLGLKIFGYKPSFTQAGLGFASSGQGPHATFERYLNGLAEVDFSRGDGTAINAALGQFLFGDPKALMDLTVGAKAPGQHLLKPSGLPKPPNWPR